jgi:hypothetical protein
MSGQPIAQGAKITTGEKVMRPAYITFFLVGLKNSFILSIIADA